MIEKIKSVLSNQSFEMTLLNPASKNIYKVDSLNLLIGVNGSGKTKTIKSIIRDITSGRPPTEFICEGDIRDLGIIYYTAVPFHKEIPDATVENAAFSDASQGLTQHKDFIRTAQDYDDAAALLGVDKVLESVRLFDLRFEAARVVRSAMRRRFPERRSEKVELPASLRQLEDVFNKIQLIDRRYRDVTRDKSERSNELLRHQQQSVSSDAVSEAVVDSPTNVRSRIRELDKRLADLAAEKQHLESIFETESLREIGPRNRRELALWIAYFKTPNNSPSKRRLGDALLWSPAGEIDISQFPAFVEHIVQTVLDFEEQLQQTGCGSFAMNGRFLTISANIPSLLRSGLPPQLVEDAHRLDLLEIGFGRSSSGEAAIFHQMTSLSHSIRQLFAKGAKSFLIFIDEGDMLLHLEWQRRYLGLIDDRLGWLKRELQLSSLQVIVATHSPLLATDVLRDSITRMGDSKLVPAFGAPLQKIVNDGFNTKAVGSIAERKIRELTEKSVFNEVDFSIIDQIDDDFVKTYIKSKKARR